MFDYDALAGLDAKAAAAWVSDCFRSMVDSETRLLLLAAHWADLHSVDSDGVLGEAVPRDVPGERLRLLGGEGTPEVSEFAGAELGALQETTTSAALSLMADALDLRHRLPQLWDRVRAGQVRAWKARKVAQATRQLTQQAAGSVDEAVAGFIMSLPWNRFQLVLEARVMAADPAGADARARIWEAERFVRAGRQSAGGLKLLVARASAGDVIWFMAMVDRIAEILMLEGDSDTADVRRSKAIGILAQPAKALQLLCAHEADDDGRNLDQPGIGLVEGADHQSIPMPAEVDKIDPRKLRPRATLYIHVSEESVTRDSSGVARFEGVGPVTVDQMRRFLGPNCQVRVQPVIDVSSVPPVDGYEIPHRLREAIALRNPADVFPFGSNLSRTMDLDHTIPYLAPDDGGPPGQTSMENLGPLSRSHHRAKTHGRWQLRQPSAGMYLWQSPHGWMFLVNQAGSHSLGNNPFAQAIWRAANPESDATQSGVA